eukprot:1871749-Amphidinium_carterae.1
MALLLPERKFSLLRVVVRASSRRHTNASSKALNECIHRDQRAACSCCKLEETLQQKFILGFDLRPFQTETRHRKRPVDMPNKVGLVVAFFVVSTVSVHEVCFKH